MFKFFTKKNLIIFSCILFLFLAIFLGRKIPISQQTVLYSGVFTWSAITFAVLGLWISTFYPIEIRELLEILPDPKILKDKTSLSNLSFLANSLKWSFYIGMFSLMFQLILLFGQHIEILHSYYKVGRIISLSVIVLIFHAQIYCILYALTPLKKILNGAKTLLGL